MTKVLHTLCFSLLLLVKSTNAQTLPASSTQLPILPEINTRILTGIADKYEALEKKMEAFSENSTRKLVKLEKSLVDNLTSKGALATASSQLSGLGLKELVNKAISHRTTISGSHYFPYLDSVQTGMSFLLQNSGTVDPTVINEVGAVSNAITKLIGSWENALAFNKMIADRKRALEDLLTNAGLLKSVEKLNRAIRTYQQQFVEFRSLLNDPDKLGRRVLTSLGKLPAFDNFLHTNSQLAGLFSLPGSNSADVQLPPGLQSKMDLEGQLSGRLGSAPNVQQHFSALSEKAIEKLNALKNSVNERLNGGDEFSSPEFAEAGPKRRKLWNKIEFGINIQSQSANQILPVTSDIAVTLGYKLGEKSVLGVGMSYKVGFGKSFRHLELSGQGNSYRSFLDLKLKGSFWISGGYEINYQPEYVRQDVILGLDAWNKSGLVGITKRYKLGKKYGKLQLLWDFLSYQQVPNTSAMKFRIGYIF